MAKHEQIQFLGKLPRNKVAVAVSGGPDSMAVLDFLIRGKREVTALYFNHGTEHGDEAEAFIRNYCNSKNIRLIVGRVERERNPKESPEEYWRNERYNFLERYTETEIVMAHNLDDQIEQYIFSTLHGTPRLIPYRRNNIIRPFILTKKETLTSWCDRKGVPYLVDPSNSSSKYMRSFIRTEVVEKALVVNPGLHKMIRKKIVSDFC